MKQLPPASAFCVVNDREGVRSICLLCFLTVRARERQSLEEAQRMHAAVCIPLHDTPLALSNFR